MSRFMGGKSISNRTLLRSPSATGKSLIRSHEAGDYSVDPIYENQQRQLATNLNPFSSNNLQATNALVIIQTLQTIASKGNVMLLLVGGTVSISLQVFQVLN